MSWSDSGPPEQVRAAVWDRDQARCVACGTRLRRDQDWHSIQHRLPRGRGGDNRLANLILSCGSATTGCHGRMEGNHRWAEAAGYSVRGYDPSLPAEVPVLHHRRGWVLLTDAGDVLDYGAAAPVRPAIR